MAQPGLSKSGAKKQDVGFDSSGEVHATGDVGLLREAISNLVENAIQYTPADGVITVGARSENGSCIVEVTDNGPGVSSEDLPRLGERFMRGRAGAKAGGSGLGLAIATSIVQKHGGSLELRPRTEGGLRATLRWPIALRMEEKAHD